MGQNPVVTTRKHEAGISGMVGMRRAACHRCCCMHDSPAVDFLRRFQQAMCPRMRHWEQ